MTVVWLMAAVSARAEAPCPPSPVGKVDVVVRLGIAPVTYHTDLDRRALARQAKGLAAGRHPGETLGLTVASYAVSFKAQHQMLPAGDGRLCVWPRRIDARLFIPAATIHIASDFARGSCQYRAIQAHEQQHVRITEEVMRTAAPRLEEYLRRAAAGLAPLRASDPRRAGDAMDDALTGSLKGFMDDLNRQAELANRSIDGDASYAKVAAACKRW